MHLTFDLEVKGHVGQGQIRIPKKGRWAHNNVKLLHIITDLITNCGKLMLLDKMLPVLRKKGSKMLIFSQMTMMLNILEDYCDMRKYKFGRLDGSMKLADRQQQVNYNSCYTM